jgi:hypothetical protein
MIRLKTEQAQIDNLQLAAVFDEVASLLEAQGANPFRVKAYRTGAETIRRLPSPVQQILKQEGVEGLRELPGIGASLANAIEQLQHTGHLPLLDRLRGDDIAERLFATVPDIGPTLARRVHEELGIESLIELEAAANDGRLARVAGMGAKRIQAVREALAGRLVLSQRVRPSTSDEAGKERSEAGGRVSAEVPIAELLDVDQQYRSLADQGKLPRIAPRSFNPTNASWLPVLHTERGDRHYTALFSNTSRAHEMGTVHDWVVIYRDDKSDHARWTVITAHFGKLKGRRIVCGRETECEHYYSHVQP